MKCARACAKGVIEYKTCFNGASADYKIEAFPFFYNGIMNPGGMNHEQNSFARG